MKKILFAIAAVCCIALTSACTKSVYYGLDAKSLRYPSSKEDVAKAFSAECSQVSNNFSGTSFTEDQYITAISVVVDKYNHKYIDGPFHIYKETSDNIIKTFNMVMTVGYDKSSLIIAAGKESEFVKFSNAVQEVTTKYNNMVYSLDTYLSEMDKVVEEYDHDSIMGTFKVWAGDSSTITKEYKMVFAE